MMTSTEKFLLVLLGICFLASVWATLCFVVSAKIRCKRCPYYLRCEGEALPTSDVIEPTINQS